jgi:fatty-acid desaturase
VKTCREVVDRATIAESVVSVQIAVTVAIVVIVVAAMIVADVVIVVIAETVVSVVTVASVQIAVNVANVVAHRTLQETQLLFLLKMSSMLSCVATSATWVRVAKHVATADTRGRQTPSTFERASTGNRDWLFCSKRLRSIT